MTTTTQRISADELFDYATNGTALEQEIERDLIDYIMGLWHQHKQAAMVRDYGGAIKLKSNDTTTGKW